MFINVNELVIKYYTSLRNVVSTLNLGCVLNLKNIALEARNTYNLLKHYNLVIL